ncbi:MAG: transcription termination factor NusA [Planctomycetota bacterium]|jgi:N utilization substance protein A|nr:transcription termination factor NusA [Planctomycetota bacterium]
MDPSEFLRLVDSISRERGLDKETIIDDIEKALMQAANKRFDQTGEFTLTIDRETGEIRAFEDEEPVELTNLGRIVANVAKQVIMQRLREGERDLLFDEFESRIHTIISGTVMRVERGTVIVQLGRAESILPREEQIPGEIYRPGAVMRAYLLNVAKKGQRVRLVLSRTHVNFVRELFQQEIPEIADGNIEIKGIVREPGRRTKIAVSSTDPRIDPVGSCVGMRGSRITKIADELGGEKIDIIPWAEEPAQFIINSLKPAAILKVSYDTFRDRAKVVVSQDQLPLAIGKAGQNVRLSARLTRYKIDVCSEEQARENRMAGAQALQPLVDAGLIEDFLREVLLDEHLDAPWVIAAQTAEILCDSFEEFQMTPDKAQALIDKADSLLDDEQRDEKNELIRRRVEEAAAAAEAEARALEEAQQAAVEASLEGGQD